ncbi:unnamed protein product [Choristocarpus tenellus]
MSPSTTRGHLVRKTYLNVTTTILLIAMKTAAVFAMCCAGAQAFAPVAVSRGAFASKVATARTSSESQVVMVGEKSASIPFLLRPPMLDGTMTGDLGFDPLGLSENINLPYGELAEVKHGRIAMLAVVGFLTTQYVHLPGEMFNYGPLEAVANVPLAAHVQIFRVIACAEFASMNRLIVEDDSDPLAMLPQDPQSVQLFSKKSPEKQELLRLQELKHGRLAMMAIVGEVVQMSLFHTVSCVE